MAKAGDQARKASTGTFFAAYPDDSGLTPLVDKIKLVISEEHHLTPHDWRRPGPGFGWHPQLFDALRQSSLVVAICSDSRIDNRVNANVAMEVGFAFALGKPVLLLCEDKNKMSADLEADQYLVFDRANINDYAFERDLRRMLAAKLGARRTAARVYFFNSSQFDTLRDTVTFLVKLVHFLTQVFVYASKASIDLRNPSERQNPDDIVSHYLFCIKADGTFTFLDVAPELFSDLTRRVRDLDAVCCFAEYDEEAADNKSRKKDDEFRNKLDVVRACHSSLDKKSRDINDIHTLANHSKSILPGAITYLDETLSQAGLLIPKIGRHR